MKQKDYDARRKGKDQRREIEENGGLLKRIWIVFELMFHSFRRVFLGRHSQLTFSGHSQFFHASLALQLSFRNGNCKKA